MKVGQRVLNLLKEYKKTQSELAEYIGIKQGTISDWSEKRKNTSPSSDLIPKIAAFFNVSTDYILGLTDSATPHAQQGEILSDPEHELLSGYRQLDESDQGEVRGYIKGMLNNDKYKTHNEEAIG